MQLIKEPLLYHTSPPLKLFSLLLIILISLLFTLIFAMAGGYLFFGSELMDYLMDGSLTESPELLPMLKYLQMVNSVGLFIIPPLLFAYLVSKNPSAYLALNRRPALVSAVLGAMAIVIILPFIHWTAGINEMLSLPEWMSGIESWMKSSEDQAERLTGLFLATGSFTGLTVNLLMIAILPAIGEEFLFRGVLLRIFREWTGNVHLAAVISAFLFSAIHLQFYGFLPRFILGLLLAYLFIWSGSIWIPVIVHFFNNGIAVVAAWLYERGSISTSVDAIGESPQTFMIIASLLMVVVLTAMIRYYEGKKKGSTIE